MGKVLIVDEAYKYMSDKGADYRKGYVVGFQDGQSGQKWRFLGGATTAEKVDAQKGYNSGFADGRRCYSCPSNCTVHGQEKKMATVEEFVEQIILHLANSGYQRSEVEEIIKAQIDSVYAPVIEGKMRIVG